MKTLLLVVIIAALSGCGSGGTASADYAHLFHYPADEYSVVCYYLSDAPGSLSCVKE
jgi:hypothetical protein